MSIDWDAWRADHSRMDFQDQQAFYALVAKEHPEQQHFDVEKAAEAFDYIDEDFLSVIELGGWDGALADHLIPRYSIKGWRNYDVADVPQVCSHPAYLRVVLNDYFWNTTGLRYTGDVFVATHTIEHLTAVELGLLFDALAVNFIYLEAPLQWEGQDWRGYRGSHILELGWHGVGDLLVFRGYTCAYFSGDSWLWSR